MPHYFRSAHIPSLGQTSTKPNGSRADPSRTSLFSVDLIEQLTWREIPSVAAKGNFAKCFRRSGKPKALRQGRALAHSRPRRMQKPPPLARRGLPC